MTVKTLFFALLVLVVSGFLSGSAREADSSTRLSLGCAVGDVLPDGAVVWLRAEAESEVLVRYSRDPDLKVFAATQAVVVKETSDFTATLVLRGLEPATVYHYQGVVVGKEPGPVCKFVTAPRPDSLTDVQFAFGGCTRESFQPFSIMESIRVMAPDFFVLMGDTIYADRDGPPASKLEEFWSKYVRNRNDGSMQRLLSATSLYVAWDDHEVVNNYDSGHPLAPIGQKAFFDYWPIQQHPEDPHRLYRSFRWGKAVELFILDTRQYRDPAARTMLGEKQKKWLLEALSSSTAQFKFILSSVPFSSSRKDKWGGFREERKEIVGFVARQGIKGVIFLASDVHYAAVSKVPGGGKSGLKEFIAGPMAGPLNVDIKRKPKRYEFFSNDALNYGMVRVYAKAQNPYADITILDVQNTVLSHTRIPLSAVVLE